jgi:glycerophosphoryl diester phosphodiesterase
MNLHAASSILVHGHRGARAMRPENTLPAFRYAIESGVDALELDMAVTRDGVLVISHDPVLEPPVCTGPAGGTAVIHRLTLAQVREWDCGKVRNPNFPKQQPVPGTRMPTLDEVFDLAPLGNFDFNIETKIFADKPEYAPSPEEFVWLVLQCIRKHKLERRVILQSFDFRTLLEMKRIAPEIRTSALIVGKPRDFVIVAHSAKADIISPHFSMVSPEQVAAAHKAGILVVPWTANTPAEWDPLIAAGSDAIISDDPAALIAYLKARK